MRANNCPISSGVTSARFWMVSLDPSVRDCDVPRVVPSVSLTPVVSDVPSVCDRDVPGVSLAPGVSDVPSVCDRDVPCETPSERPLFQPFEPPVLKESDQLRLSFFWILSFPNPPTKNSDVGVHDRPSV